MRALLLSIAVGLAACVIDPSSPQRIATSWTIEHLDGTEMRCPANWVTTTLVTTDASGAHTEARFPCALGRGTSAELAEGAYVGWLEFADDAGKVLATSLHETLDVGGVTTPLDTKIYVDAGYVAASWTWKDKRWCDDSFNPFEAISLALDGPGGFTQVFSCHDDAGITAPIAPGTYGVSIGQGFSRQSLPDLVVEAPNRVTQLPPITL